MVSFPHSRWFYLWPRAFFHVYCGFIFVVSCALECARGCRAHTQRGTTTTRRCALQLLISVWLARTELFMVFFCCPIHMYSIILCSVWVGAPISIDVAFETRSAFARHLCVTKMPAEIHPQGDLESEHVQHTCCLARLRSRLDLMRLRCTCCLVMGYPAL